MKTSKTECATCTGMEYATAIDDIKSDFKLKKSNDEILKAFAADTFSEFLGKLFLNESCPELQAIFLDPMGWEVGWSDKMKDYNSSISKIKEVLSKDNPVIVDGLCSDEEKPKSSKDCDGTHSLLITGYRSICKVDPKTSKPSTNKADCRDVVKVHNSYGQKWQDDHDGGWVNAKEILDRTFYKKAAFTWLTEKYP